jgi:hypothetical protein
MKTIKCYLMFAALVLLVSCGGGGGSAGDTGNGNTGGNPTVGAVSDLSLDGVPSQVPNGQNNAFSFTVSVVDANRNAISGVSLQITLGDISGGASLAGGPFVTDAQGKAKVDVSIGSIKRDRTVVIRAAAGSVVREGSFEIVGSAMQVTLIPGNPNPGSTVTAEVALTDSSNSAIANEPLTLTTPQGINGPINTNGQGRAVFSFTAPALAGTYTLQVTGSGITATRSFQVVGAGGGTTIPPAVGPILGADLSATPAVVSINTGGATTNRAQLRAVFLGAGNSPISNVRTRFAIIPGASGGTLGAGEFLTSGSQLLLSDGSGVSTTEYVAGSRSSPTDGVLVQVCYSLTDFPVGQCPNSRTATFTVAANPLSITIGVNNEIEKIDNNLRYLKRYVVQVSDSAGQPVRQALVSFSLDIYKYGKGVWTQPYATDVVTPTPGTNTFTITRVPPPDDGADNLGSSGVNTWCPTEDTNRNQQLEGLEDRDGDGALDPRQASIIIEAPGGNRTNDSGAMILEVKYPMDVGGWLAYSVTASANVQGSEGTFRRRFITTVAEADVPNGSFRTPPYGVVASCTSPN